MNEIEELLKLAESDSDAPVISPAKKLRKSRYIKQVLRFIEEKGIQSGTVKIPVHKLMYEYYKWDGLKTNNRASCQELGRIFASYFKAGRNGRTRFYYLNEFTPIDRHVLRESLFYYRKYFTSRINKKKVVS